ncbi:hypothetical protein KAW18_03970 [candidate division WOR-3 bacterium]|nr:hypothetical protein [candidate division WOR-3 bacterium]
MLCPTIVFKHSNAFVQKNVTTINCSSCGYPINPDKSFFRCLKCGITEEDRNYYDEAYMVPEKELCFE